MIVNPGHKPEALKELFLYPDSQATGYISEPDRNPGINIETKQNKNIPLFDSNQKHSKHWETQTVITTSDD